MPLFAWATFRPKIPAETPTTLNMDIADVRMAGDVDLTSVDKDDADYDKLEVRKEVAARYPPTFEVEKKGPATFAATSGTDSQGLGILEYAQDKVIAAPGVDPILLVLVMLEMKSWVQETAGQNAHM